MVRTLIKTLKIVIALFAILLLVLALVIGGVIATEPGTRFTLEKALGAVPGTSIERIDGTLWHGLTLSGVRHDDGAGTQISVDSARLAVAWPALMSAQLHVRELALIGTRVALPAGEPAPEEERPFDLDALIPELPVSIRVDTLVIDDFKLQPGPDAEWIIVDALRATSSTDATQFELSDLALSVSAPVAVSLEAAATLELTAPYVLSARLSGTAGGEQGQLVWSLDSTGPPEALRTTGRFDWTGTETPDTGITLDVTHGYSTARIDAVNVAMLDGQLTLKGDVDWADGVVWDLALAARDLQPAPFIDQADGPVRFDLTTRGQLAPDGTLTHETVLSEASASFAGVAISQLALDVTGGLDNANIRALSLNVLDGSLAASGSASWGDEVRWQLAAEALDINPAALAQAAAGTLSLRLESEGSFDAADNRLSHVSRLQDARGDIATVTFDGLGLRVGGDLENIRVDEIAGRILGATLTGNADIRLGDIIAWDARMSFDDADLSLLAAHVEPAIAGRIGFDLDSQGELRDGQPHLTANLARLRGTIEGQTLDGSIRAQVAGDVVTLSPADISLGINRIQLSGTVTPPFDLRYEIELPSLSALPLPEDLALTGRIEGTGALRGTLAAPELDTRVSGRGIAVADFRLDRIELEAQARTDTVDARLSLTRLEAAGQQVDALTLNASGRLDAHQIDLDASTDFGRLRLDLDGGVAEQTWSGRLARLDLTDTPAGDWALAQAAAVQASATGFSLAQTCLIERGREGATPPGRLCAEASRSGDAPTLATLAATLPFALVREFIPPNLNVPGSVAIDASASIGAQLGVDALVTLPDNHIIASGLTEQPLRIDYRDTRIQITVRDDQLDAQVSAQLPAYLSLTGDIQARLDAEQTLQGSVALDMPDLSWLNAVTPAVADLTGAVRADITLGGTLSAPTPTGTLRVERLAMMVPDTGVAYHEGEIDVAIDAAQQLTANGRLTGLSGGALRIGGDGSLAALPDWRAALTIEGTDLPLLRTAELVMDISPDLTITADQAGAEVRGRVVLPVVEARVHTLPAGSVGESPDLVLADTVAETPPAYRLRTDIEIILGDQVSLDGMGFSTGLTGQIRLRGDEAAPIAAFGEVDLRDGRYSAYGQDLRVDQGRLTFNGPLDDPGLDVRASRSVEGYQAGLEIRGTLLNPRSQVFSVPALPESDALSLLLTGRLLSAGTSGSDATLLVNALAGLGVAQGDEIMRDIGQKIGFDELGLDTDGGFEGTQLTVAKRLSARLLVRYAVGVFDGVGRFITEFKINRFLDLEITSSAEAQGGDLIYRIER